MEEKIKNNKTQAMQILRTALNGKLGYIPETNWAFNFNFIEGGYYKVEVGKMDSDKFITHSKGLEQKQTKSVEDTIKDELKLIGSKTNIFLDKKLYKRY